MTCAEFRRSIALGERGMEEHAESCPACRCEARGLEDLLGVLERGASVEVPAAIDAAVRRSIRTGPLGLPSRLWATAAMVLSGLGLTAVGTGVSMALAPTRIGPTAPVVAILAMVAYLVLSGTALLPILFRFALPARGEVRR